MDGANSDLYAEHLPMAMHGFAELAAGRLPLWNPHQLLGMPFFAVPHTGLLYPGNLPYLLFDAALATEISLIVHLLGAGLGMWLLTRSLGFEAPAAAAAAVTQMWAGAVVAVVNQSTPVAGICWMPASVWLVERSLRGGRVAPFGLVLAVAFQVLNGAPERLLYNLYAAGLWALGRLGARALAGAPVRALRDGARVAACVAAGLLLAAPQLLPSLELVAASGRGSGDLPLSELLGHGRGQVAPGQLLEQVLRFRGWGTVGFLPLLGAAFGLGWPRRRWLWGFALALAALAALLASGGAVYRLYVLTPIGGYFRLPMRFLTLFAFALSLLAALATERLCAWRRARATPGALWREPAWLAALAVLLGGLAWLGREGAGNPVLAGALALLAAFGLTARPALRGALIALLLLLQMGGLFVAKSQTGTRPVRARDAHGSQRELLDELVHRAGHGRIYVSPELLYQPALTLKQGLLTGGYFSVDYEPLALRRYARFFARASRPPEEPARFAGFYDLHGRSRWSLMDLTATRLYLFSNGGHDDLFLEREGRALGFRRYRRTASLAIWMRPDALPRARFVPAARVLPDGEAVLAALEAPDFDPRHELLLEAPAPLDGSAAPGRDAAGFVRIARLEAERVDLEVESDGPGWVLLADLHYPGWNARVDGRPAALLRANYLMRAVAVGPGRSRVRFDYRPASLRWGIGVGAATALGLAALFARSRRPADREVPSA